MARLTTSAAVARSILAIPAQASVSFALTARELNSHTLWCWKNKPRHPLPWQWAKRHWMEFLHELDTDTGKMMVEMAHRNRQRQD